MDLKQALQQQRGSACTTSLNHKDPLRSSNEGGSHNSSSSNSSTNTGESNRVNYHDASPIFSPNTAFSGNPVALALRRHAGELHESDNRVLKLARFHDDPPSPHSTLETQALINLHGSCSSSLTTNNSSLTYLNNSAHNSNHPSPTSNYQNTTSNFHNITSLHSSSSSGVQQLSFSFNGGALSQSPTALSKPYPVFTSMEESRSHQPLMLSATPAFSHGVLSHLSTAARNHQLANFQGLTSGPASVFTPEQLLELTQQTYVFKHFTAGVTPPPSLLLPFISSAASSMGRVGAGPFHFGGNAGLYSVGTLRGHLDLEPGRCRRTDGKKWRCARDVVPDQKYCERHMHRGRHRGRGKEPNATTAVASSMASIADTAEPPNQSQLPSQNALGTSNTLSNTSNVASGIPATSCTVTAVKEPQLQFSLHQPSSRDASRSLGAILSAGNNNSLASRNAAAEPPPNLAELLKGSQPAFPFTCQTTHRDAANLVLRQFVSPDWPTPSRVVDRPPPPPPATLSWIDQLAEERRKHNTELSMATTHLSSNSSLRSPLNLSSKFGGGDEEEMPMDIPNYIGLSMASSNKLPIKEADHSYGTMRTTWIPIAWDSPSIGGPLAEALQSNGVASSGGDFRGSLANNEGGEGCLNLIEASWDDDEHVSGNTAKGSHSHSLASPTGVLQVKASYSDSSSSASSPRSSALKLEAAANRAM